MQVDLIYHKTTGTVLSALSRVAALGGEDEVDASAPDELHLRGPGTPAILPIGPFWLRRFTAEADEQLEQLMSDPWRFGVEDKTLVTYDKLMTVSWNGDKLEATFSSAPLSGLRIVFLVCRPSDAGGLALDMTPRDADGETDTFESKEAPDAKWGLVLAAGYRTRAALP